MNITIEVQCETIGEFCSQLTELIRQIKREARRLGLKLDDEFPEDVYLDDYNPYGKHEVTVKE